jgi:hypothetical protein
MHQRGGGGGGKLYVPESRGEKTGNAPIPLCVFDRKGGGGFILIDQEQGSADCAIRLENKGIVNVTLGNFNFSVNFNRTLMVLSRDRSSGQMPWTPVGSKKGRGF